MSYLSKLGHIAHYKSQNTVKTNFSERAVTHARAHTHTHTHPPTHTHTHTLTQAHAHTSILTTQNLIYAQLKGTTNRDLRRGKRRQQRGTENMAGLQFWEKKGFRLHFNESREGFCRRERGRSLHVDRQETENVHFFTGQHKPRAHFSGPIPFSKQ